MRYEHLDQLEASDPSPSLLASVREMMSANVVPSDLEDFSDLLDDAGINTFSAYENVAGTSPITRRRPGRPKGSTDKRPRQRRAARMQSAA